MKLTNRVLVFVFCLAMFFTVGCETDQSDPLSSADHIEYIQKDIDVVDQSRQREMTAKQYEKQITSLLLLHDEIVTCDIRLVSPDYCVGPVTADDPFICLAIITSQDAANAARSKFLFLEAMADCGLEVSRYWPNPFGPSPGIEPLNWHVQDQTIALDYARAYPVGSSRTPSENAGFNPVKIEP